MISNILYINKQKPTKQKKKTNERKTKQNKRMVYLPTSKIFPSVIATLKFSWI